DHDVSDGGVCATLAEMSFAGRTGLDVKLQTQDVLATLFAEEVGVVIQVRNSDVSLVEEMFKYTQIQLCAIAKLISSDE
ncbi:AIR synthase-related protein, partial [Francisella tularensis]|uniref:AIR synthase-related protein n=1 Tax=Francisella tularensis TaxID=263 RepID=UPI002381AB0E